MTTKKPQMKSRNIEFACTEIGGLWGVFYQESLSFCFLTYFVKHVQDGEIAPLANEALEIARGRLDRIRRLMEDEHFPVPTAFTEADVKPDAPPLFHDPFVLSYLYMMNRLSMINYAYVASNNVRLDVLDFFTECLHTSTESFGKAVKLMLSKGIYDRPPKMNYPDRIECVHDGSMFSGFLSKDRQLNAIELTEIFFNIERNYFSVIIMLGFAQVVQDKKLKKFILKGKKISENQINFFNDLLKRSDLLGTVPITMEVTESTESPFSNKLIVAMINALNSVDISLISHALSVSMRVDLVAQYTKIIGEVMLYAKDTFDIMVEREWLEQPPLVADRDKLIHS